MANYRKDIGRSWLITVVKDSLRSWLITGVKDTSRSWLSLHVRLDVTLDFF